MTRRVITAGLLPLLLVAAAACSKSDDGRGVASAGGSATPRPTTTLSFLEQGIKHAQCMRANGVPEADPQVQGDNVRVGGGFDKSTIDHDVLEKALAACRQYEPVLSADEVEAKTSMAREEARCMRANGVENFPDPQPDLRFEVPDAVRQDPQYDAAAAACIRHGGRGPSATPR